MCHRFAWSRLVLGTRLRRADASALTVCGALAAAWNAARTARAATLTARAALIAAVATSPIAVVAAVATLAAAAAAAVAASTFAAAHAAAAVATLAASRKHASHRRSERVCALGLLWSLNCSGDSSLALSRASWPSRRKARRLVARVWKAKVPLASRDSAIEMATA